MDQAAYTSLADYPQQRVTVEEIGIFRGHRLYALEVRPIAYNPATNRIDLYRKIDVNVRFGPSMTPVQRRLDMPGLQRFLLNDGAFQTAQSGSGNYLIVVASDYASAISSFATAKAAQGYNVDTYSVAGGTTNTAIKSLYRVALGNRQRAGLRVARRRYRQDPALDRWRNGNAGHRPQLHLHGRRK